MVNKTQTVDGRPSVSGGRDLKESQAYTPAFGYATVDLWRAEPPLAPQDLSKARIPNFWVHLKKQDRWEDAKVAEVLQYLTTC